MGVGVSARRRAARDQPNPGDMGTERLRRAFDSPPVVLGVLGVLALGVVLRFVCQSDMWADEVLSVNIARLPLGRITTALRHDGAPPLYYLLLHAWMRVFGTGTASVRALSGLAGTLTLIPMWFIGRRLDLRRVRLGLAPADAPAVVAWSALLLFALSPFAIRYSTEARMYALVMLFVALGYLAVVRALERPTAVRLVERGAAHRRVALHPLLVVLAARGHRGRRGRGRGPRRSRRTCRAAARARCARRRPAHVPAVGSGLPVPAAPHRDAVGRARQSRRELVGGVQLVRWQCARGRVDAARAGAARCLRRGRRRRPSPRRARPRDRARRAGGGRGRVRHGGARAPDRPTDRHHVRRSLRVGGVPALRRGRPPSGCSRSATHACARECSSWRSCWAPGAGQQRRPSAHAGVPAGTDHPRPGRTR